ncbi:adenylosuccinate synthase [Candidatus Micrarchaeota archaeon RBG_16_49_10]|nr:MAG: adenylosuccinate synthase [Candidatus Micrarchaeota archaeon RBG_16_49_10]
MSGIVVVGTQWGDEGKGKIVDYLAEKADAVVRFQGGNNAGHTVVAGEEVYKFHLLPSGVVQGKLGVLGAGMVINPKVLLEEIEGLKKRGIEPNLLVSQKAHVIFPFQIQQDGLSDVAQGKLSAGSTKRGIAPAYSDKAARNGIRMVDLLDRKIFEEKLENLYRIKKKTLEFVYGQKIQSKKLDIFDEYFGYGKRLSKYIGNESKEVNGLLDEGKTVLFEGAQGTLLGVDHGMYPFGTSSDAIAGGACTGAGVGPTKIDEAIGVVKAYTSRVGSSPFPTELTDKTGDQIREKGHEYGTTTGRPRRCGWLDLVNVRHAVMINGLTSLAVTKLDVLGGLRKLKVCVSYKHKGKAIADQPFDLRVFRECEPVYEELEGWEDLPDSEWLRIADEGYYSLPKQLREYLEFVEKDAGVPIKIISFGADRKATIDLR